MANTASNQKELPFAERLTKALNAIEAAQEKVKEAQEEYESAKQALSDELKGLPHDHPLRALTSPSSAATTRRARSRNVDQDAIRESILEQLRDKKSLKATDFDVGSADKSAFQRVLRQLAAEGAIKKQGEKRGTTYLPR